MRRKDREITDPGKIEDIINRCHCCRIGFNDNGEVYIVPLSFGYANDNGRYTFYFHGASAGRKFELIQGCPQVGFELDTNYLLHEAEGNTACTCSARFQSIIGNGIIEPITDREKKIIGLTAIMEHNCGKRDWVFEDAMLEEVSVFKLTVSQLSCKEHL